MRGDARDLARDGGSNTQLNQFALAGQDASVIASRIGDPNAVELMQGRVDDMVLVSEDALRVAQDELTAELGITVEGAAAASWAGLLAGGAHWTRRRHRHREQRLRRPDHRRASVRATR